MAYQSAQVYSGEKKPAEGFSSKRARAPCRLQTWGFYRKEEPGKVWGEIFHCSLSTVHF
jgi:hypothetical protein